MASGFPETNVGKTARSFLETSSARTVLVTSTPLSSQSLVVQFFNASASASRKRITAYLDRVAVLDLISLSPACTSLVAISWYTGSLNPLYGARLLRLAGSLY